MDLDEVLRLLREAGLKVATEKRLGNDTGTQLRLTNKAIINVFDKGTISFQGLNTDAVKAALSAGVAVAETPTQSAVKRKVL